jgi:hypothetical protein
MMQLTAPEMSQIRDQQIYLYAGIVANATTKEKGKGSKVLMNHSLLVQDVRLNYNVLLRYSEIQVTTLYRSSSWQS